MPTTMLSSEAEHDLDRRHPAVAQQQAMRSPDIESAMALGGGSRKSRNGERARRRPPRARAAPAPRRSARRCRTRGRAIAPGEISLHARLHLLDARAKSQRALAVIGHRVDVSARAARRGQGTDRGFRGCKRANSGVSRMARVRGRGRSMSITRSICPGRGVITMTRSERNTASAHAVGDEQDGHAPLVPDLLEVEHQLVAGERIERAERLVHQELRRVVNERATERDALPHAAGELVRVFVLEAAEADRGQQLACAPFGGAAFELLRLRLQHDVAERGAPFQQHGTLEHDADVGAGLRRRGVPSTAISPLDGGHEPGRDHEQRALAAAARPDDGEKFAAPLAHRDLIERAHRPVARRVDLAQSLQAQEGRSGSALAGATDDIASVACQPQVLFAVGCGGMNSAPVGTKSLV